MPLAFDLLLPHICAARRPLFLVTLVAHVAYFGLVITLTQSLLG